MMRAIQKSAGSFFTKLLLIGVAATFALWGVGDMFRGGVTGSYALKAGEKEISLAEFRDELNARYGALRQMMGANFTQEMAQRLGIHQQVVSDLRTALLVISEAEAIGLSIPDEEILEAMQQTDAFQDNDGKFNKDYFTAALKRAGVSEERYVESLKKEKLSRLLLEPFNNYIPSVRTAAEKLYIQRNETRGATFYLFTPRIKKSDLGEPGEKQLQDYYKRYGEQFRRPEFRKFSSVTLDKKQLKESLVLEEAELKKRYDDQIERFTAPEQRELSQLLYAERESADAALADLQSGKSFAEVVKTHPPENEMLSLGIVTGDALPKEARAEVFGLEAKALSSIIKTDFGWHIFRVESITPQSIAPFAEVKESLLEEWQANEMEDRIYELTVELEDSVAAGISLAEAAEELGYESTESDWVNAVGETLEGSKSDLADKLIQQGFALADESDSALYEAEDESYHFIAIAERKPSFIPAIEEIESDLLVAWETKTLRDKQREKSVTIAEGIAKDSSKLTSDLFRALSVNDLMREGELPASLAKKVVELPPALRNEVFTQEQNGTTGAYLVNSETPLYAIARVNSVDSITTDSKEALQEIAKIEVELRKQYADDVISLYLQHLAKKYVVEVNEAAIAQLMR
jgi:peptidyl-prolyl cis-trans isomerase D